MAREKRGNGTEADVNVAAESRRYTRAACIVADVGKQLSVSFL